jgi:hypothetical protein
MKVNERGVEVKFCSYVWQLLCTIAQPYSLSRPQQYIYIYIYFIFCFSCITSLRAWSSFPTCNPLTLRDCSVCSSLLYCQHLTKCNVFVVLTQLLKIYLPHSTWSSPLVRALLFTVNVLRNLFFYISIIIIIIIIGPFPCLLTEK